MANDTQQLVNMIAASARRLGELPEGAREHDAELGRFYEFCARLHGVRVRLGEPGRLCSFCGKDECEVVVGPGLNICYGCVAFCKEMEEAERRREADLGDRIARQVERALGGPSVREAIVAAVRLELGLEAIIQKRGR